MRRVLSSLLAMPFLLAAMVARAADPALAVPNAVLGNRCCMGFAYYPDASKLVLYGGIDNAGVVHSDTWLFDGTSWTQLCADNKCGPGKRTSTRMVYVGGSVNKIMIFGGKSSQNDVDAMGSGWFLSYNTSTHKFKWQPCSDLGWCTTGEPTQRS